jgi:hypothetical protein
MTGNFSKILLLGQVKYSFDSFVSELFVGELTTQYQRQSLFGAECDWNVFMQNKKLVRSGNDAVVANFAILSRHSPPSTEETPHASDYIV